MRIKNERHPEEPTPLRVLAPHWKRWDWLVGLFLGSLPLLLALPSASTGWILPGGSTDSFTITGAPWWITVVTIPSVPWLFLGVCVATVVCLLIKPARRIGWGLLMAVLLTLLWLWFFSALQQGLDERLVPLLSNLF